MRVFEVVIALLVGGAALAAAAFQRIQEELDWAQFLGEADG